MRKKLSLMHELFGTNEYQEFQDDIAASVGLAIIVVDYLGKPITKHSSRIEFCGKVREDPRYKMLCERCDARGGLEAARTQSPYIYLCHANLADVAIPIVVENVYVGAFMAGEVSLADPQDRQELEQIYCDPDLHAAAMFANAYTKVPVMSLKKIKTIASMLHTLCNLILENYSLELKVEKLLRNTPESYLKAREATDRAEQVPPRMPNQLEEAASYIDQHLYDDLSLKKVAAVVNMSPNYFSRLFSKHYGTKFTAYVTERRIKHAKNLLLATNMTVNEIADKLGYNDSSYFIKVFSDSVGQTPSVFRKDPKNMNSTAENQR